MNTDNTLTVRSHVARDLLQTSALFKTDRVVVWEYVSNGLDYVEEGVAPIVNVLIDSSARRITISDNGRGMDWRGLANYFTMHGENIDRRSGRPKRGLFGTGKSAAFGIAEMLTIRTVRNGAESIVRLSRSAIKRMSSDAPVPVEVIARERSVSLANGTEVAIDGIRTRIDVGGVTQYIQQQLAYSFRAARVFVNNREVEYEEPAATNVRQFRPSQEQAQAIGQAVLTIKVAAAPLEEALRGVAIFSNGVLHERTLCGLEGKEMSQYLFGEIDVPMLDVEGDADVPAFDMSRSSRLNPENALVRVVFSFVGQHLDVVRRELVDADKQRKTTEEAKRLAREASAIARMINDDFREFREKVARVRSSRAGAGPDYSGFQSDVNGSDAIAGVGHRAKVLEEEGGVGTDGTGERGDGSAPRMLGPKLQLDETGVQARPASRSTTQRSMSGGFAVRFDHMGDAESRAKYLRDERTIYLNLDHPQLVAARGTAQIDDPLFRQLSYEIAFSEYAIALASELNTHGEYMEPSDPIVDIRSSINRLARRAAKLFQR